MNIIGIDPGLNGALAWICDDGFVDAYLTPTVPTGKGNKRDFDIPAMVGLLPDGDYAVHDWNVFIEKAQPYPKQGAVSNFTTGGGYYLWLGIVGAIGIRYTAVHPKTWQKVMFAGMGKITDTKAASTYRATQLFPDVNLRPGKRKKKHDGMSDALLIAEFGRRELGGRHE